MTEGGAGLSSSYDGEAALYIHWPFCLKKCPYCDFNSHVRANTDQNAWKTALLTEIDHFATLMPGLTVSSVFFGGGTPSLMPESTVGAVLDRISNSWKTAPDMEVTLEANPSSVESRRFRGYRTAGVNRVSVGIQSLRDEALAFLGRLHSAREATDALKVARDTFDRVSFDLIYARPGMTVPDWRAELLDALAFQPDHMSLYQLTIEEGTAFHHQFSRGKYSLPDDDTCVDLFNATQALTTDAGLPAYEVSNHARLGQESRHNLAYWTGLPYIGIGPGAHGRIAVNGDRHMAHNQIKRPEDWLQAVDAQGHGTEGMTLIDPEERFTEEIMMGLRLSRGINIAKTADRLGIGAEDLLDTSVLAGFIEDGYLRQDNSRLALTPKGVPVMNFILSRLFA